METPEMVEKEIEISEELYDLVSIRATEEGCTEEGVVEAALRWFLDEGMDKEAL